MYRDGGIGVLRPAILRLGGSPVPGVCEGLQVLVGACARVGRPFDAGAGQGRRPAARVPSREAPPASVRLKSIPAAQPAFLANGNPCGPPLPLCRLALLACGWAGGAPSQCRRRWALAGRRCLARMVSAARRMRFRGWAGAAARPAAAARGGRAARSGVAAAPVGMRRASCPSSDPVQARSLAAARSNTRWDGLAAASPSSVVAATLLPPPHPVATSGMQAQRMCIMLKRGFNKSPHAPPPCTGGAAAAVAPRPRRPHERHLPVRRRLRQRAHGRVRRHLGRGVRLSEEFICQAPGGGSAGAGARAPCNLALRISSDLIHIRFRVSVISALPERAAGLAAQSSAFGGMPHAGHAGAAAADSGALRPFPHRHRSLLQPWSVPERSPAPQSQ